MDLITLKILINKIDENIYLLNELVKIVKLCKIKQLKLLDMHMIGI